MSVIEFGRRSSRPHFQRVEEAIFPEDAVTVQIFRNKDGQPAATVGWYPDRVDGVFLDSPPAESMAPEDAIEVAEAAEERRGLSRIVVFVEDDDLWDPRWGILDREAPQPRE
jgi:hypothetical protein